MFGHKKLLREGAQAQGVILDLTPHIEPGRAAGTVTGAGGMQQHVEAEPAWTSAYEFKVRIAFDDGVTAEETFKTDWSDWTKVGYPGNVIFASLGTRLQPGQAVPVRYDSRNHGKVVLDLPALQEEIYASWQPVE